MPIRWYPGYGWVGIRILRRPFEDGVYYDEYVLSDEQDDPNPTVYIPVDEEDIYAMEITFFKGFNMRAYNHLRSRLYHPGQLTGPARLLNRPIPEALLRAGCLIDNMVEVIDRRNQGVIKGVDMRDLMFIVKGLIIDPDLPLNGPSKDLNAFTVDVYPYSEIKERIADAINPGYGHRRAEGRGGHARRGPKKDDWLLNNRVDRESARKGVKHTTGYTGGIAVAHQTPRARPAGWRPRKPLYKTRSDVRDGNPLAFHYRYASRRHIRKGGFVKLDFVKPEHNFDDVDSESEDKKEIKKEIKDEIKEETKSVKGEISDREMEKMRASRLNRFAGSPSSSRKMKRSETPFQREINSKRNRENDNISKKTPKKSSSWNRPLASSSSRPSNRSSDPVRKRKAHQDNSKENPIVIDDDDDDDISPTPASKPSKSLSHLGKRFRDESPSPRSKRRKSSGSSSLEIPDSRSESGFEDEEALMRNDSNARFPSFRRKSKATSQGKRLGSNLDDTDDEDSDQNPSNSYSGSRTKNRRALPPKTRKSESIDLDTSDSNAEDNDIHPSKSRPSTSKRPNPYSHHYNSDGAFRVGIDDDGEDGDDNDDEEDDSNKNDTYHVGSSDDAYYDGFD